jgi:hypothetical protein
VDDAFVDKILENDTHHRNLMLRWKDDKRYPGKIQVLVTQESADLSGPPHSRTCPRFNNPDTRWVALAAS